MTYVLTGGGLLIAIGAVAYYWRFTAIRESLSKRLLTPAIGSEQVLVTVKPFAQRHFLIPILLGIIVGLVLAFLFSWPLNISIGLAFAITLMGFEADAWFYETRLTKIESQLADSIDLLVASLGAGSSLQASLVQAADYTENPLKRELSELVARLRLGDSPADAFELLEKRVPTETFQLLATSLVVNWQVGGGLAETLAGVGKTIRDRLAISRQIRTLSTQGRLTTMTVISVVWFMAAMMWQSDEMRFVGFVNSQPGSWLMTATLTLQGVGIAMVSKISRPRI
ncbi:type II secretion system F family protein [bacterium]|nr:type II secretion system F family protein [bacterium]MDA7928338.1 type II secretion system F family protein [Mariniblastus sp.]